WVLDISVTPNRGDCLSVIGIARELSVLFGCPLKTPEFSIQEADIDVGSALSVEIVDTRGCPRYAARFIDGIVIAKSPFTMRRRLFQSGVRAINNVVDITNYVMLEYGQPLHAFDSTLLAGPAIVVRRAREGERFVTLDSVERVLRDTDLLICDREKPVALAGVMGGENSEVLPGTTSVVLESAYFDPDGIRRTSKSLGLTTEASYRFERGVDPGIQVEAANRAAYLMERHARGRVYRGVIDVNHLQDTRAAITLSAGTLERVLGVQPPAEGEVERIFTALGCEVRRIEGGWSVSAPPFRPDVEREIDLVEEFVRIHGMDKVTPELPAFRPTPGGVSRPSLRDLRRSLAAMGFNEVITYSFISPRWKDFFPGDSLRLVNPISDEMSLMRTSLVPGLLGALERNRRLQTRDVCIFEIGRTFHPVEGAGLPREEERLGVLMSGMRFDQHWSDQPRQVDFYDLKGLAELLIPGVTVRPSDLPHLESGRQGDLVLDGEVIGCLGAVHPSIRTIIDASEDVFVLETVLGPVIERRWKGLAEIPRFPFTWRDLSLVVDEKIPYADIVREVESLGIGEIRKVAALDVYSGEKLPRGKRGVTIRITYQSLERTLEDAEISAWQERVISRLGESLGITLRG
ncbi:MAG TPA: phenylalanine--tRNA ligase subunit beta, partial [Deltaproteobacteria bacterium]|nr:phenylalanine--tRNA ligase subunit beta [Deltaproteobacteria bacterium]